jgi:FtsZ-interacting cell division protein ZipA
MSTLQLALVVAGVLLVIGVILYNRWQERRVRERAEAGPPSTAREEPRVRDERVEPTLRTGDDEPVALATPTGVTPTLPRAGTEIEHDPAWQPPMDAVVRLEQDEVVESSDTRSAEDDVPPDPGGLQMPRARTVPMPSTVAAPDPDIETVVRLQPVRAVAAGTVAAGLHARLGKPVRWYGRRDANGPWQRLASDSRGEYSEIAGCMLLADRNGPATQLQIESFHRLAGEVAGSLPGAFTASAAADEAERAEALDRLCAELDMQIGLTVRKVPPATIAGTRLRGVAEAAGFRLAPTGRFEFVQDETGAVLFTLQSLTDEAFTLESLRHAATPGVVFLLDVPRVADPPRAFDQMKLAAKRMALTVGGELVDDNGRPLNDAGLASIREQVVAADQALHRHNIEPGSPRALKLFTA